MRISLLRCAAMLVALLPAVSQAAPDPGAIGLGLDQLKMHMTMEDAKRGYPALIDMNPRRLSLQDYQLEGCRFSVDLFFTDNGLTIIKFDTREPVGFGLSPAFDCKPAIVKRLAEQYGATQSPGPSSDAGYSRRNDVMGIGVGEAIGYGCGLIHDNDRHLFISFIAPDAPVLIC